MSHVLDKLTFFTNKAPETFAGGHGITTDENRDWERAYRGRWAHDKIVRSTHGVNCTGSCSWKIYVKNGLVTWETQQQIILVRAPIYLIMNLVDVRVVQAIAGIFIVQQG